MKRKLLFVLASLLVFGSMKAQQQPTHYPFNYHDFPDNMTAIIQVQINGTEQTSNELELGAFNGDMVTGAERIGCYGSNHYYRVYLSVYGSGGSYEVTFKLYNHQTGEELDNYVVTYQGDPYTFTWVGDSGIGSNKKPIVINFATTSTQTFTKEIIGYGNSNGGYYLIASPIDDVNPAEIDGMIANPAENYDLYWFDQTQNLEWINYKAENFNMVSGMGYLYANKNGVTLNFTGTPVEGPTYEVSLVKDDEAQFPGWNLVGNPFAEHTAYIDRDCYVMNTEGRFEIIASDTRSIEAMEGAFVIATENDETLTFSTEAPVKGSMVTLNLSNGRSIIDRAIVRFGEGRRLPKFQLRNNSTKVYIPIDGQYFAVVRSEGLGEMPIGFKAEENGTYTISINAEEVSFSYLHLIDNMTGNDIDLLATSSYSFEAKTTDYATRFKLVFICEDANDDNGFAFFSNGNYIINNDGDAALQLVDMTGRIVKSETINGSANINIKVAPGVYMLRLVNGDNVKMQKIVVR